VNPKLFILKPSFADPKAGPGEYFCPDSVAIEGLLALFPALRQRLDVQHVDFARPRTAVIGELGEANQACPVLVLPPEWPDVPTTARRSEGRAFFVGAGEIASFLSQWAGTPRPHP
jgi:hypothetical protein